MAHVEDIPIVIMAKVVEEDPKIKVPWILVFYIIIIMMPHYMDI